MPTVFTIIYFGIAALFVLPIARAMIASVAYGSPDTEDYVMATVCGLLISSLWPVVLVAIPFYRALRKPAPVDMEKR